MLLTWKIAQLAGPTTANQLCWPAC